MTESEIQRTVFRHLNKRAFKGAVFWHVPNDQTSRRKSGYRAGVSDVCVVHRGEFFALELKKDGGRPSEEQLEFVDDVQRAGGYSAVAEGLDQALACLEAWGILRRAA